MRIEKFASYLILSGALCAGLAGRSAKAQSVTATGSDAAGFGAAMAPGFELAGDADATPVKPKKPVIFDLTSIDKTADPCTNFYQYACGNWLKNNPLPGDQTRWSRFNELADTNNYLLYVDLKAAADAPKSPLQKKYGDYFAACMNVGVVDSLGAKPIEAELAAIDKLEDKKQFTALDLELTKRFGGGALFGVGVQQDQKDSSQQILGTGQGGLTLPDRDYYLTDDARSQTLREQYVAHMVKMFMLLGDTQDKAAEEAAAVMRIETALAKGSMSRVEMRDPAKRYHIMTITEVEALSPAFDWTAFVNGLGLGAAKTMNVSSPGFLKTANEELETENVQALKSYMRWHAVHSAAPYLAKAFEEENFDFFSRTLQGQKEEQPRWKRCVRLTDGALGEAVGQEWVKQNFPGDSKANMEKLVAALEKALGQDIQSLPWMSDATKQEAEAKLTAIRQKIGYPAQWRDYSKLTVKRDDLVGNLERSEIFERDRNLTKLGKPVDESEWGMTPPTVNAYYSPPQNDINFPAGILQPPFYANTMDPAVNFGGIGVVIGHEMTHGFDDQGSKYDPKGNVRSWFTEDDLKQFQAKTDCVADEYSGFEAAPGQNLNGKLTLGENTADNGGIRIAFQALQATLAADPQALATYTDGKKDGYTPDQRFFITFGQVWCQNQSEAAARVSAKTDPHSPGEWRANGTVQNFDAFGKAFGCKVGQPMMPEKSCRVW
jgi:putative endopeptidase